MMLDAFGSQPSDEDWDRATIEATVRTIADFAAGTLVPANADGDRTGCLLEDGAVRVPAALEAAYATYLDAGLHLLALPEKFGGLEAPALVQAAATELIAGACHAFQMLVGLVPGAAKIIAYGLPEARAAQLIAPLAEGAALATMALTEPDAGSDLSHIRLSARQDGEVWRLSGNKIFISGGGQSLTGDIVHLVLARTGTRSDGRAELSLFAVPGTERVTVARLEEKLGLHASPTCELNFAGATGELIGKPGGGLSAMFPMMNHARIDVALQGVGHAAAVTQLANDYAATRIQGRGPDGKRVPISGHGDVKRMLAEMDAATLSIRAMCLFSLLKENEPILDLLTPIIKAHSTDRSLEVIDIGIQVLGGYGYLPEYGIEQHWRDARITRIYEGTNGIMAMTLATRLLSDEELVDGFLERLAASAAGAIKPFATALSAGVAAWADAADQVRAAPDRGLPASPFLSLTGELWSLCALSEFARRAGSAVGDRLAGLDVFAAHRAEAEFARLGMRIRALSSADAF
jgi:hypothetical protein